MVLCKLTLRQITILSLTLNERPLPLNGLRAHTQLAAFRSVSFSSTSSMKYVKPLKLFEEMMKRKVSKRERLLGLDVGDKYVGLAISDSNNKIASPLSVLLRKKENIDLMAHDFQSLISEFNLAGLVVGYPFNRQLSAPDAVQVKILIDDLSATKKLEGVHYTYWNEGFTSKDVDLLLQHLNLHPVESKTILDKFAAVGILQEYLDHMNKKVKYGGKE